MKKFFVLLCVPFVGIAHATTVNIDWLMDGSTYAQTTCETGGNFALPSPTPTKYGYHFVGWQQNDAIGSWSQSGTPTPTNPIYPTFKTFGNTVLRAVGGGDNLIADTYDPTTRKITRRVGVKVLDGTDSLYEIDNGCMILIGTAIPKANATTSSHFLVSLLTDPAEPAILWTSPTNPRLQIVDRTRTLFYDATTANQFFINQYNAGTPVTIYYPLATPVEENYNAQ